MLCNSILLHSATKSPLNIYRTYARDRVAGRSLNKITKENPTGPAEPIINHPSVRQLLLFQKSIAEGGRSMVFDCAKRADVMEEAAANGDHELAKKIDDRLGFMTPILKVSIRIFTFFFSSSVHFA
jgi:alkylation response protein AidB-like acyl-CoA dehydrogenase